MKSHVPLTFARLPIATFALATLAVAIHLIPGAAEWLQYDRAALARGEIWRWFTGHLTHFESNHLIWDVGVLLVLGRAAEHESRRRYLQTLLVSAFAISAAVWLWQPQFAVYRGLSGLDSALFACLASSLLRGNQPAAKLVGGLALAAIGGKCAFEIVCDATVFASGASYAPVPLAHAVGLVVGLAFVFWPRRTTDSTRPAQPLVTTAG